MSSRRTFILGALFTASFLPSASASTDKNGFVRINAGEEDWKSPFGVGIEVAVLHGDPSKAGIYVIRIKWPPGIMSRPHKHPEDRHAIVLSGTWYTGTGEDFRPETAIPMKAGGYMMHPAGAIHWDGTRDEGAIIQITGYGPSANILVDPNGPEFGSSK